MRKVLAVALILLAVPALAEVNLDDGVCAVSIDPATLRVTIRAAGKDPVIVSAAQTNLGSVQGLRETATNASWEYPEEQISVDVTLSGQTMLAHFLSGHTGGFAFPVISQPPSARGWILPLFEGSYAPCDDSQWASFLVERGVMNTTADLVMPFIGLDCGGFTVTYIFTNAFNNELEFQKSSTGLSARLTHQFTRNHAVKEFAVAVEVGGASPVEPARLYRQWVRRAGDFVTLKEKIARTPAAAKLLGAAHAYIWGAGLQPGDVKDWKKFCRDLKEQGGGEKATPARRVWQLLKPETRRFVEQLLGQQWPDRYTKLQIVGGLNRLLAQPELMSGQGASTNHLAAAGFLASAFPGDFADPVRWGNGQSIKMIEQLSAAGLDRMWLGCDNWDGLIDRPQIVAAAKKAGYLIGPYDSFNSIHSPAETDTWETAQFDQSLYETGAVIKADGSKKRGFKKKGYILSPDAARPAVEKRVTALMNRFHANSWFIDCDGFGEYMDDYSPVHPATQQSDMQSRISRMKWIRDTFGAVIGTEGCSSGVASTVDFAHGVMTPVIGWGDKELSDPKSKYYTGGYYPPNAPKCFFMPAPTKEEYSHIYFDPRFRLPLFQIVFHDSVIATHHWSCGSFKTSDHAQTVELLELLYNIPPLYHLNLEEFQKRRAQIIHHYQFFSPLHRLLAERPMTAFQWLVPDHTVQLTTFGDQIDFVANFGRDSFDFHGITIAPGSIVARWRDARKPLVYSP